MPLDTNTAYKALVPLKVVLITERPGDGYDAIRSAISRAFQGGGAGADSGEAYFAAGEDLGVAVLETEFAKDPIAAREVVEKAIDSALHCLLVVLLDEMPRGEFAVWLSELDGRAQDDPLSGRTPRPGLLPIAIREDVWRGETQALDFSTLGEKALRPGYAAVHVLFCAWRLLGAEGDRLKLFISHAKLDGLPLARSFKHQLEGFPGIRRFYDAEDIPAGSSWKRVLERGVESSVLVALRTNVYGGRVWCVQELDWAEDHGCPVVVVDARTQLVSAREVLPLAGSPCVYIPDGNLVRTLQAALREALRIRLFARQVQALGMPGFIAPEGILKVPRSSLNTLGMRCLSRAAGTQKATHIFIPEPFRKAHYEVALKLAQAWFPNVWLGTPRQWLDEAIAK